MSLTPPPEHQQDPPPGRSSARAALTIFLALALLMALVTTAVLGIRLRDQRNKTSLLQQQLSALDDELAQLRADLRGSGDGDPLAAIVSAVSRLRGLHFKHAVKAALLSPSELAARVGQLFREGNTRAELAGESAVLAAYGLVPAHYDLYDDLLKILQEEVVGFFDPHTGRMNVSVSDASKPTPMVRIFLAHEYTHALTDQNFDLGRLDQLGKNDDDAAAAFSALEEGDATYLMNLFETEVLTSEEQTQYLKQISAASANTPLYDAAPAYLRDVLDFPYLQGVDFVQTLHDRGGFALIDQAYRDPPRSTEQILHPARYLDTRDDPTPVKLPDVARALGRSWHSISSGGAGEFDVLELLDRGGGNGLDYAEARGAADGWDGGAYEGFKSSSGIVVTTLTVWDSQSQAREAQDAFKRWLAVRYPGGNGFEGRGSGWASDAGAGEVARDGARLLLVLGSNRHDVETATSAFAGF